MPENTPTPEDEALRSAPGVLSAINLKKAFGATDALGGLDLELRRGESVAIMGPSGSGKSTLLHTLAGIEAPDIGSVHFRDPAGASGAVDITALGEGARSRLRRQSFGFVFQSGLLIPELTAVENVAMALMITGIPRSTAVPHAAEWLQALGLAGLEERRIGQLSGGQAQRVAIARSQITGATVTFADEPTGALDSATSSEVLEILLQATIGRGNTLVMVTHDQEVASRCHRIIHLLDGRIRHDADASAARPGARA
ncbi:MAG: ABC transporter ATP-binding protein [Arthrobacter sp.]|uniref:ABC transporter ATP-binding protein n=1 Tax=unclassified Arthrobacter TaxID=235627 RepID=UPI0026540057|nr:ABC transporter ATP-binding protein [Micrococcaceae bacterium]MDN5813687.1 ABC transporter ATP-binding protein [Micrococcaceae bacterium]MDN5824721.1 ABC transporter ATP-binding protein [Micrococcaceae bacterium]MDN5878611.1 ABC transporter ATP-binding protein [Micrococcaceae bacterium]MDN5886172.1 ABC transporter ATP-binding protein [Micrococcaceae bacterium]